jgi:hypothetical protein
VGDLQPPTLTADGTDVSRWPLVLLILTPLWLGLAWAAAEVLIHLL